MIEKFLIKRCSTEVQVMLKRMKERPEDFDYGTTWRKLVEMADDATSYYTKTERIMVKKYWKECRHERMRRELLDRIMAETINPSKLEGMEDYDDKLRRQYQQNLAKSMMSTKQALQGGVLSDYTDPRALYGQYGANIAQGRIV